MSQKNNKIIFGLVLLIIIAVATISVKIYLWPRSTKDSIDYQKQIDIIQNQNNALETENKNLKFLMQNKQQVVQEELFWNTDWLKSKGLKNPVEDLKKNLLEHSDEFLIVGFQFVPKTIYMLSDKWFFASFEDGNIAGYMILEYKVSDDAGISWKVVKSHMMFSKEL